MAGCIDFANKIVWGAPALILILGVGIFLSVRTGFIQLRLFPMACHAFLDKLKSKSDDSGVSPFQALCTALAATMGTSWVWRARLPSAARARSSGCGFQVSLE